MKNLLAVSILLVGCSSTPGDDARPVGVPPGLIRPEAAAKPAPKTIPALTLEEALALADGHPELRELMARAEAAKGRADQAALWSNPEAILRIESAPFNSPGDGEFVAGISQRLALGGRLGAAERIELLEAEKLGHEHAARRLQRRSRVHAAFAVALHLTEAETAHAELVSHGEAGERLAKARIDAGDGLPEELARAELETLKLRVELERVRGLRAAAMVALAGEMGLGDSRITAVTGNLSQAFELPALEALQQAIDRHPEVLAADGDIAVQRGKIALAEAQRIPDLSVDLLYRRLGATKESAFDVGIGIAIPFTDRNQGRLREAHAEEVAAAARLSVTRIRLAAELKEAHVRLTLALATAKRLRDEVIPRANAILAAYEKRYSLGDASLSDVLPVRRDRAALKLAQLDALRDVMTEWSKMAPAFANR